MSTDPLEQALAELGPRGALLQRETQTFGSIAAGSTKVVIAGCGYLGQRALAGARAAGLEVLAFADNDPTRWGNTLEGVPIMRLEDAVSQHNDDAFFVVAIYNGTPPRRQLADLGCLRIVPYPLFFWQFFRYMPEEDRLELPHRIVQATHQIREGYALLADELSRQEFASQIAWRCSLDYSRLAPPQPASAMYFAPDVVHLSSAEVLVDCGAFNGDSIRLFFDRTGRAFRAIYAIEPDPKNRFELERYVSALPRADRDRIRIFPFGVSDFSGTVLFAASGTAGSGIATSEGTDVIECRRLDDLLEGLPVSIIKMDIEGSEPAALRGATATIRRTRPILAVCAYHKCEHLWTLPALMSEALPEYQLFLRRYAEECWETVYYAVPPERVIAGTSN